MKYNIKRQQIIQNEEGMLEKIKKKLGWDTKHNINDALSKTIKWYISKFKDNFFDSVSAYDFIEHIPRIISYQQNKINYSIQKHYYYKINSV